jgi:hypothetical protein
MKDIHALKHGEEIFRKTCMVYNMLKRFYMFWNMILKTCQEIFIWFETCLKQVEKDFHVLKHGSNMLRRIYMLYNMPQGPMQTCFKTCLKYVGNDLNALKMPKTCQKRFTCFEMC